MLRLSPRGEIAPPWRDINERTPCAVKAQCTRCRAQNDALRAHLETITSMSCPAKSDVSDFARLIAAEVGQGRLRVKAGHPITPGESGGYWIARFRGR